MEKVDEMDEVDVINKNAIDKNVTKKKWTYIAPAGDFPEDLGVCARVGREQIAIFNLAGTGEWYACQNKCPHKGDNVLSRGIVGNAGEEPKVACPMHKKSFFLKTGACLGENYSIKTYPVKLEGDGVYVQV